MSPVSPDHVIQQLRGEVKDVKECFTQFSFQSATLATVGAAFILQSGNAWVTLTGIPIIVVLLYVCRIGIFKYTTANRNLGYQLHLERLAAYERRYADQPKVLERIGYIRDIGWEEALRAWRVVHASLFARLYTVPKIEADRSGVFDRLRGDRSMPRPLRPWWNPLWPATLDPALYDIRENHRNYETIAQELRARPAKDALPDNGAFQYAWWNQEKLTEPNPITEHTSHYHTGNFLRTMLGGLYFIQWCYMALIAWGVARLLWRTPSWTWFGPLAVVAVAAIACGWRAMRLRQKRLDRRRAILEDELVSIHSSALVWGVVGIAHYAAMNNPDRLYHRYTERLARLAEFTHLIDLPSRIDRYIRSGHWPFDEKAFDGVLLETVLDERDPGPMLAV